MSCLREALGDLIQVYRLAVFINNVNLFEISIFNAPQPANEILFFIQNKRFISIFTIRVKIKKGIIPVLSDSSFTLDN